ncbi:MULTISPECIES: class I SAM-dependent methyltransferase [Paenibacillus]|uniref:class I SAM-dependent methyltransferase n=1 Tax=Paenibacillus TaxID=44249 RepID=UPI0022B8B8EB|nr:class I SAM-dependent methyltransferase [Paenibacillus caseinilyticus]MCZ8521997.1 class I SAM-dependent methyltransferase [Paenibacillus caseinilyticus]
MDKVTDSNRAGWSRHAYEAWIRGKGRPEELAEQLRRDPGKKLAPFGTLLGDLRGKRAANLLGSNGKAAVALALLGAEVTVVDLSPENARYAGELAAAAGVRLRYIVSDVMAIPAEEPMEGFDLVLMELGILHWLQDLRAFFGRVAGMLRPGGRMVLRDYHPVARKLLRWKGGQVTADGNYFDESLEPGVVPYAVFLTAEERAGLSTVYTRGWTMGEIVTAVAEAGLMIRSLQEERGSAQRWVFPEEAPSGTEDRLPGIYILAADRPPE